MRLTTAFALTLLGLTNAYPNILAHLENSDKRDTAPAAEGLVPFDAASQLVNVRGKHAFRPPGRGDQRGPCPGLNALANHNYLPHDGVATIEQFIESTSQGKALPPT